MGAVVAMATLIISLLLPVACEDSKDQQAKDSSLPSTQISAISSDSGNIQVEVRVPAGFHAYLDRGKEGNLIPVTFFWDDLVQAGVLTEKPQTLEAPEGSFDSHFNATVLRGNGIYLFKTKGTAGLQGNTIRVQTQICDDAKGICYRPRTDAVKIR